jgi:hypothetical protein
VVRERQDASFMATDPFFGTIFYRCDMPKTLEDRGPQ